MSTVVVTSAVTEDADQLASMYEWLFEPPGSPALGWTKERGARAIRRVIGSDAATVFVAKLDGDFVGFCTVYDDIESVRFGRRVWVEDLAVHPDHRSQGIGKRLLDEAKHWARARGAARLQLDSGQARTEAHRFYDREHPGWRSVCFGWEL